MFADRTEAGEALGALLAERGEHADVVLGIPRGGVVVAAPVATALECPLDVALARKVGAPHNPELAVGAVGPDGPAVVDQAVVSHVALTRDWLEGAIATEAEEVQRRLERF